MSIRFRARLLAVPVLAFAAIAGSATLASASPVGHPGPVPTPPVVTPTPTPTPAPNPFRPEFFRIVLSDSSGINSVVAFGPVHGNGRNVDTSAVTSQFRFGFGNRVNVDHAALGTPVVNFRACTATVNQNAVWTFNGGRGLFRNAQGFGRYNLSAVFRFPRLRHGFCTLRLVRGNPLNQNRVQPRSDLIIVTGSGLARA